MNSIVKSDHAITRVSQRSVSDRKLELTINNIQPKRHKDKWVYYVRNKDLKRMLESDVVKKQEVDKLRNLVVIATEREQVVTAYYADRCKQKRILRL